MSEHFIALKCTNCGGKLDVYDDMNRFSCGYCGSEMMVNRRGGTVSIDRIEGVLGDVKKSSDKTAAELAIVRLKDELRVAEEAKEEKSPGAGCLFGFIGICLVIAAFYAFKDSIMTGAILGFFAGVMFLINYNELQKLWKWASDADEKINALKVKLEENMKIANE